MLFCFSVLKRNICFNERFEDKEGGSGSDDYYSGSTLEECQNRCLDTAECLSLSYFSDTSNSYCLIFHREIPEASLQTQTGGIHINKKCTGI